jgi:hypothetical protein
MRIGSLFILAGCIAAGLGLCASGARASAGGSSAAELCVGNNPGCFTTIQAAVDAADDGDTIRIGPGSFGGGITILKSVQLVGVSAGATTIAGGGPVLTIGELLGVSHPTVSISRVTITGGFNNSEGVAAGGGVSIPFAGFGVSGATVAISDSVITRNRVAPRGLFPPGPFCGPTQCAVAWGGGIDNSGTLTLSNTHVSENLAGSTPGAESSVATIAQGGGIRNHPGATLTLSRSFVTRNRAATTTPNGQFANGGGIADDGVLGIVDSFVRGNSVEVSSSVPSSFPFDLEQTAEAGGILITGSGSATITRTTVSNNSVSSSNAGGDALALAAGIDSDGSLVLSDSRVSHNMVSASVPPTSGATAVAAIGGIETASVATIRTSLISGNSVTANSATGAASAAAGGLGNTGQTTVQKTLVIGNRVTANGAGGSAQGGGISNFSLGGPPPQLTLMDSVVAANKLAASSGITPQGGGIFTAFPLTLIRTAVVGNQPDQCFGC